MSRSDEQPVPEGRRGRRRHGNREPAAVNTSAATVTQPAAQPPAEPPEPGVRTRLLHPLDWVAIGVFVVGVGCVLTGLLPTADASATVRRILPLLVFLGSVIVLAELTAEAEVFDVIAARLAIMARGNYLALFLLCVLFASINTISLNLDTTAVLLTPVMLALAVKVRTTAIPFAVTTVWLANTASLLLPVSNLTNLLAADRLALEPAEFVARMWLPALASILTTMLFLWVFYWRRGLRGSDRYEPPAPHVPRERVLFAVASLACVLFVAGILAGIPIGVASLVAAGVVVAAFAVRSRDRLRPGMLPWRLLVFVTGLFLVVQTISQHGLDHALQAMVGDGGGAAGAFRAALTSGGLSNVLNNLPAYVAVEGVVPAHHLDQLVAALIGTNVGPIITPWASMATLIWHERCTAAGVRIPMRRFVLTGAGLAVVGLGASVGALLLAG